MHFFFYLSDLVPPLTFFHSTLFQNRLELLFRIHFFLSQASRFLTYGLISYNRILQRQTPLPNQYGNQLCNFVQVNIIQCTLINIGTHLLNNKAQHFSYLHISKCLICIQKTFKILAYFLDLEVQLTLKKYWLITCYFSSLNSRMKIHILSFLFHLISGDLLVFWNSVLSN